MELFLLVYIAVMITNCFIGIVILDNKWPLEIREKMKRLICCKKHWLTIKKQIKIVDFKPYKQWFGMKGLLPTGSIYGEDFDVEIRPYLKKVWVFDLDDFKWRLPIKEDIVPENKYKVSKLSGVRALWPLKR